MIHSYHMFIMSSRECIKNLVFNIGNSVFCQLLADLTICFRKHYFRLTGLDSDAFKCEIVDQCVLDNKFVYVRKNNTECVCFE